MDNVRSIQTWSVCAAAVMGLMMGSRLAAQASNLNAAAEEIVRADSAFAQSVAKKDRQAFLSFIADVTTFNGGTPDEVHGRDAVMKDWADFFEPNGPTLEWTPIKGEVIGAGDVGYTTGGSTFRRRGDDGKAVERHGQYLTAWRKQKDGSWTVVFDTGSTLPTAR